MYRWVSCKLHLSTITMVENLLKNLYSGLIVELKTIINEVHLWTGRLWVHDTCMEYMRSYYCSAMDLINFSGITWICSIHVPNTKKSIFHTRTSSHLIHQPFLIGRHCFGVVENKLCSLWLSWEMKLIWYVQPSYIHQPTT